MSDSSPDLELLLRDTFIAAIEHHEVLDSTNDHAKEVAARGAALVPRLILADRQKAGRGRGQNRWWTGSGSLALSLLVDLGAFGVLRPRQPMVALAAGIATVEAVAPCVAPRKPGLHWPNDVYVAGRKLAGVLVESAVGGLYVVGIGINTNNTLDDAPQELRDTAVTLLDLTGQTHDHTQILVRLLRSFECLLRELGAVPERVGRKANNLCLQHGQALTLDQGDQTATGVCVGIAPDGALLLQTAAGVEPFYSGVLRQARPA